MRAALRSVLAAGGLMCASGATEVSALVCEDGETGGYYAAAGAVVYFDMTRRRSMRVAGADAASFEVYRQECGSGLYGRDNYGVYYKGERILGAHVESFRPLKGQYASDENWWYGGGKPIATRKRGDLRILGAGWGAYASHEDGAFYGAQRLELDGFEVLGHGGYAKSRNRAYYRGEEIPGIDAASFEVVPSQLWTARDKSQIVVQGRVQQRLDAASFESLGGAGGLTRDKHHVYMLSKPIAGADPASFAAIGFGYWRDRASVYFSSRPIEGADPGSFRLIERRMAADRHRVYWDGKPVGGADPATFRMLANGYARDSRAIYYLDRRLDDADLPTFHTVRSAGNARDRSYGYQYGKPVCAWPGAASSGLPACDPRSYVAK
jgi:hypothetical protein